MSASGSGDPAAADQTGFDHAILIQSLRLIRGWLGATGLDPVEQEVLERLVHSSGDLTIAPDLRFAIGGKSWGVAPGGHRGGGAGPETSRPGTICGPAMAALAAGAPILTDTAMAAAAVAPMAGRTFGNPVHSVLAWAPEHAPAGGTRTAAGIERALREHRGALVLLGSAPTALERLLELVAAGTVAPPPLVIGMPVGFVGVAESKRHLALSGLPQIRLEGSRGGAGLVAAAVNALLRRAWLDRQDPSSGGPGA